MKKTLIILVATAFIVSCGNKEEEITTATLIENGDAMAIQDKRDALVTEQHEISTQLKELNAKLKELSPEGNFPLITAFTAEEVEFNHVLELQGSVETDENIIITPEMGGILQRLYVKEGQSVTKGQLLAIIDDGGMGQQLAQMQVQSDLAKTTFERQEKLWNQKIGSEIQFLQAKSAYDGQQKAMNSMRQQLGKATVRAPFSGTIDDIITEAGSVVAPGQTELMRIVSLKDMYIIADVPETYINDVIKGKNVEVYFPVLGKTLDAKVSQTGNFINPNNRTYKVEIGVPNKGDMIKPNLTARLKVNDYTNEKAILIPQSIISENADGEQFVYKLTDIASENAIAVRAVIKTGKTKGDSIEVLDGLTAGDQLIEEGARSVKDGQEVKIITY
jgi:membrane fusion protein (multidrug efflux system)